MKTSFQPSGFAAFVRHKSLSETNFVKFPYGKLLKANDDNFASQNRPQFPKKGGFRYSESKYYKYDHHSKGIRL